MQTEICAASIERTLTLRESEAMLSLLPLERRERLLRMKEPSRRQEILCAYTLLRMALWKQLGWREFPAIARTGHGKPYFPEYPEVQFNLSHTTGAVLVGLSEKPIGVDIEKLRPVSTRIMKRIGNASTEAEFFRCWVSWEARGKRSGQGLTGKAILGEGQYRWLPLFPGYTAGVAVSPGCSIPEAQIYVIT